MRSSWKLKKLGDLIALQRGHDLPSQARTDGMIPIMGSSGITGYHNKAKSKGPGVVIGRSGNSMGETSFCSVDYWPLNTCLYVTDFKGNDERYIYYLLKTVNFDQFNSGSAQKSLNRNAVYPYEILTTEDKNLQIKIGLVLAQLEEKIHLNTQTNKTLESIAQAIFKSWFVDFEPVKAKIAAKERWYAMQPTSEPASPVCYADETALPDLETYTNLAAMCAISGKNETELAQLQQQNPDHYQQLAETAALFPSTMVDSELGEIPEGWEISTLGDLANLNEKSWTAKNAPPEIHYVDLANTKWGVINSVETYDYSRAPSRARRVLRRSDTIIGTVRPSNGSYAFVKASNLTGSTGFAVLSPREEIFAELIYIAATAPENIERLAHLADGGAYPSVRPEVVMGTPIVLPEKIDSLQDLCSIFSRSTASMFEKSFINQEENASLAKLRDSLLPKLLSGEIDLTEIRSEVA